MILIRTDTTRIVVIIILSLNKSCNSLIPIRGHGLVEDLKDGIPILESEFFDGNEKGKLAESNDFAVTYGLKKFPISYDDVIDINIPEDAKLDFKALAKKYGHPCEEHHIVSKDGYITKLFRLPGDKKRPVFTLHGLFDASNTYIIRGNSSIGITLANAGYDVWLGNMRGNKHSRKHKHLNPDKDPEYWDFSYHEMALYDLPPTIDYILKHTGQTQIYGIGHSLAINIFCAMTSMLPEYNKKIRILIALAPAVYIHNVKLPTKIIVKFSSFFNYLFKGIGKEEIFADTSTFIRLLRTVCPVGLPGYVLCAELFIFYISGYHESELERDFVLVVMGHFSSGTSRKTLIHTAQSGKYKRFAQYDYGAKDNLRLYGSKVPPRYNLSAVTFNVAIFAGKNDKLVGVEGTERLRDELSNVVEYRLLKDKKINHVDFIWGRNAKTYLFPYILDLLLKY